jgi:hypothetical protein
VLDQIYGDGELATLPPLYADLPAISALDQARAEAQLVAAGNPFYAKVRTWASGHWDRTSSAVKNLHNGPNPALGPISGQSGNNAGVDCTNFVSTAWYFGGLHMRLIAPIPGSKGWYMIIYFGRRTWSPGWVNVGAFFKYWTMTTAEAHSAQIPDLLLYNVAASLGDVIQYDFGAGLGYSHASVITSLQGIDKIAQWSRDRPPDTRWNHFYKDPTIPPKQKARMRARVVHYFGQPPRH